MFLLSNLKNLSQIVTISLLGSYDNYCCHYVTFGAHATLFLEIVTVMTELDCNLLTVSNVSVLPFLI